jgi:hypothetical protein
MSPWISIVRSTSLSPVGCPPRSHWMRSGGWRWNCLIACTGSSRVSFGSRNRFIFTCIVSLWQIALIKTFNELLKNAMPTVIYIWSYTILKLVMLWLNDKISYAISLASLTDSSHTIPTTTTNFACVHLHLSQFNLI